MYTYLYRYLFKSWDFNKYIFKYINKIKISVNFGDVS